MAASCSGVNEVQYAALLMMVARHCGYNAGILYHYVANEQIYDRHFEQANEMLRRWRQNNMTSDFDWYEAPNPMLILNNQKNNFYDFTIEDFTMKNYNPLAPQLKLELGIWGI